MSIALIGGTGLCRLPGVDLTREEVVTRWGSVELRRGTWHGREVIFLPRHGASHALPPHRINYRANIAALKAAGASLVLASSAVGTLSPDIPPGSMALLTDFLDLTSGREHTFFDETVAHLDSTVPYCPTLRAMLGSAAADLGIALRDEAVYACTNGPRFETPAEIRAYRAMGADLVGMTSVPEVTLAREAELCYAGVAIATNWAAGIAGQPLTHGEVGEMMAQRLEELQHLLGRVVAASQPLDCPCRHALDEYSSAPALRRLAAGQA